MNDLGRMRDSGTHQQYLVVSLQVIDFLERQAMFPQCYRLKMPILLHGEYNPKDC